MTWQQASDAFLGRDLAPASRRAYRSTIERVGEALGDDATLGSLTGLVLATAMADVWPDVAPATWNQRVAVLRSFTSFCQRLGWLEADPAEALERRRVPDDRTRALSRDDVERLCTRRDVDVRDRALWRLLYETACRADEALRLNVEDLDLAQRRARISRKGGHVDVLHWATGTARLLPKIVNGRTNGPLFLAARAPSPGRAPALTDLDPSTGRARLSYRRAAEIFTAASAGATLHQLRHSRLTHLSEDGVDSVLLMAKSGHTSLRSLQRYARPGVEAVARLTAAHDPARRR